MADDGFTPPPLSPEHAEDIRRRREQTAFSPSLPQPATTEAPPGDGIDRAVAIEDALDMIARANHGFGAGFNGVIADAVGAPVDLVNAALKQAGLGSDTPVMGSHHVEQVLNNLGIPTVWDNADQVQRVAGRIGEAVGMAASVLAPQLGAARAGVVPTTALGKTFIDPARFAPGTTTAIETLIGGAGGVADAVMDELEFEDKYGRMGIQAGLALTLGLVSSPLMMRTMASGKGLPPVREAAPPAGQVRPEDVFSPRTAAEIRQSEFGDQILREFQDIRRRETPPAESILDDMIEHSKSLYRSRLDELDPDDSIWPRGIKDRMAETLAERARAGAKPRPRRPQSRGDHARDFLNRSRDALAQREKTTVRKLITAAERDIFDRAAGIRQTLLKQAGDAGKKAMKDYDLIAGAPSWAEHILKGAKKRVYAGLSETDRNYINDLILSERYSQIGGYRPANKGPVSSPDEWTALRARIRADVGDERFAELLRRTDEYFDAMRVPLRDLRENGLISEDEFARLSRFDYAPLEAIDIIDPPLRIQMGKQRITVPSSGIRPLGQDQRALINTDTEALLTQVTARAYSRIARNQANKSLYEAARDMPLDNVVRLHKPKGSKDWTRFSVMIDGDQKQFWMNNDFTSDWVTQAPLHQGMIAEMFKAPANVVRAMATGVSPEFAFRNMPRDWLYAWLAPNETFGNLYSSFMPLGFPQMGRDLLTVLPDTVRGQGRFIDYLREGGGMSFLTHGAKGEGTFAAEGVWKNALDYLGWLNAKSEILTRLAIRERAIRNGMSPSEATWTARTQIDFSQGGASAKMVDQYIPYLNASIQGLRGFGRAVRQNPGKMAFKLTQAMGAAAGLWAYNRMNYPDAYKEVNEEILANNFVIMTGETFIDQGGNRRHTYIKVPVEHSFIPFKAMADAMMARYWDGEVPKREVIQGFKNGLAVFGDPSQATMPPLARALLAASNFDVWRAENVWKGAENIPASLEYYDYPNRPTPRPAVDAAQVITSATGIEISPERLTAAMNSMLPPNMYTMMATRLYNKATTGYWQPEGVDTRLIAPEDLQARYPFVRSFVGTTHPLANIMDQTNEQVAELRGEDIELNREADTRLARMFNTPSSREKQQQEQAYRRWINSDSVPAQDKQRLLDRWVTHTKVRKAMQRVDTKGIPQMDWWINVSGLPPDQRASVFHHYYERSDPQARHRMRNLAARMPHFGTQDFWAQFKMLERAGPFGERR